MQGERLKWSYKDKKEEEKEKLRKEMEKKAEEEKRAQLQKEKDKEEELQRLGREKKEKEDEILKEREEDLAKIEPRPLKHEEITLSISISEVEEVISNQLEVEADLLVVPTIVVYSIPFRLERTENLVPVCKPVRDTPPFHLG
jgi:hypothetical protein